MRSKFACLSAFLLAVAVNTPLNAAAPTGLTYVRDIDLQGFETQPTGICVVGSDAFVVGIGNRRVIKITNATDAGASASIFATTESGDGTPVVTIPWGTGGTGEGLVSVDYRAGTGALLISGDVQAGDGKVVLLNATTGALVAQQGANLDGGSPTRTGAAAFYGTDKIIGVQSSGTNIWQFPETLDSIAWNPQVAGGGLFVRDIAVGANNAAYLSYGDPFFTATKIGFHISRDLDTNGGFDGNTNTASYYEIIDSTFYIYQGIGVFTYAADSTEYVILPLVEKGEVHFVDPTNVSNFSVFTDASLGRPSDCAVAESGGTQYLLVTQTTAHNTGAKMTVYQIGPAAVGEWMQYD